MTDLGPSIRQRSDGRLVSRGPGAVTLEDRPDLDRAPDRSGNRPIVRGARRWCVLNDLAAGERITKRQHDAANRFLDDLCTAVGGSTSSIAGLLMGGVSGGEREHLSERQRRAIRAVSRVRLMLGLNADTVFWWVIIGNRPAADYETQHRLEHGLGLRWLRIALDALDLHYNPAGKGRETLDIRGGK